MKLDRSPHVQHRGRWRTPRLPLAPGPVLCPQQQLRASSLSVTIFLLLLHHRPRPQVSGPPSGLTSSTLPLHSRQSSCIQASPTPWGHTYWRLCPACLRDHVHMLQACSSSNNKTHACWKPALGPTVLGSSHSFPAAWAACTRAESQSPSHSKSPPPRLSGSSPRSPTRLARPWLPESLFWGLAASLLSSGPVAPPAPFQCSCPSKTCYSSPLIHTPGPLP